MPPRFLVLDIEAVRDERVWTPPADNPDAFAPPHAWQPIVIGFVLLEQPAAFGAFRVRKVGAIEAPPDATVDERERIILERFETGFHGNAPTVVTWNGRRFDLPVLLLRSLRYGIPHGWYYDSRDHRYRYSEAGHCDLADAMADYGASSALGLDGMAKLIGLPGKFGTIDGAGVGAAFAAGRHEEIKRYCVSDAIQTAFLWLRWGLLKGELAPDEYRASAAALLVACEQHGGLADFVARVDRRVLLLEDPAKEGA